jgi:hypothetical protein
MVKTLAAPSVTVVSRDFQSIFFKTQKSKQNAPGVKPGAQKNKTLAAQVYLNHHQPVLLEQKLILV